MRPISAKVQEYLPVCRGDRDKIGDLLMKKNSTWNLLNQLDRLPIEETEESRQLQDKITGLFLQALATCAILLFAIFGMNLLPQAYLLDVIAGCLAIVIGFRFFLEYRYGTVFTSYAQMIGKDQKKITRKKEQAPFLTILCPTLLCHIAFRSVFGTGTLMLLSWIILWYVIYTIAFHFYAKSNPISQQPEGPSEKHEERKTKGNSSEDDESGSQK